MKEHFSEFHENTDEYFKMYEEVKGQKKHSLERKNAKLSGFPLAAAAGASLALLALIIVLCNIVRISPDSAALRVSVYGMDADGTAGYYLYRATAEKQDPAEYSDGTALQSGRLEEGAQELQLQGLEPDTEYLIVFYSEDPEGTREILSEYRFRTEKMSDSVGMIEPVSASEEKTGIPGADKPVPDDSNPEITVELSHGNAYDGASEPSHGDDDLHLGDPEPDTGAVEASQAETVPSDAGTESVPVETEPSVPETVASSVGDSYRSGDPGGGESENGTDSLTEANSESDPEESQSKSPEPVLQPEGGPVRLTDTGRGNSGYSFWFSTEFSMNGCEAEKVEIRSPGGTRILDKEELDEENGTVTVNGEAVFPYNIKNGTIQAVLYYRDKNGKQGRTESRKRTIQIGYIEESNSQSSLKLTPSGDGSECVFEGTVAGIHHGSGHIVIDSLLLMYETEKTDTASPISETVHLPVQQTESDRVSFSGSFSLPMEGKYTVTVRAEGHWEIDGMILGESFGTVRDSVYVGKSEPESESSGESESQWESEPESESPGESESQWESESESESPGESGNL